jgi:predicted esterase YcpF (UPF0227 family)
MKILFLHGKESTPETSSSARAIKEHFKNFEGYEVLVPDYKPSTRTHAEIEVFLTNYYKEYIGDEDCHVIGISLGGYWALNLTNFTKAHKVFMLNPSMKYYGAEPKIHPNVLGELILNMDDDVVDNEYNDEKYKSRFKITKFDTGGHRMTNMDNVLPVIEETIDYLTWWHPYTTDL